MPPAGSPSATRRLLTCTHSSWPSRRRSWRSPLQRPCRRSSRSSRAQRRAKSAAVGEERRQRQRRQRPRPASRPAARSASLARWMRPSRTKAMPTSDRLNISSRSRASALELALLQLQPRDVGQHRDHLDAARVGAGAAHRQRVPAHRQRRRGANSNSVSSTSPLGQRAQRLDGDRRRTCGSPREQLAQRCARPRCPAARPSMLSKRRLQRTSSVAAQVGDAGDGALEDRRHLAQQLLAAQLRLLLLGDVERHHRGGALARGQRGRLDARQQPALRRARGGAIA